MLGANERRGVFFFAELPVGLQRGTRFQGGLCQAILTS